jgi:uncharacterized protein YdeI (YjbR/CyaY-like superfamily)
LKEKELHYFKNTTAWRKWLHDNHDSSTGVFLTLYKVNSPFESMRWEEAVQVALCYGWIDSTAKRIDEHSRKQLFTPRKNKSVWSKVNKTYIKQLIADSLMHESGLAKIKIAQQNGSWTSLDAVEDLIIPEDLAFAFNHNKTSYLNYQNFSPSYRKSYLYWLNQAKREETKNVRINTIIDLCNQNKKSRD